MSETIPKHYGLVDGADALWLADKVRTTSTHLHVTEDETRLATLAECLAFFAPDLDVITLPGWDCLPYDRISPNPHVVGERVQALCALTQPVTKPRLVLVAATALVQRVPARAYFSTLGFQARTGEKLDLKAFQGFCTQAGYMRVDTVRDVGEFAIRGSIIDIFPTAAADPVRLDLFGDTIETVRLFDAATQISGARIPALVLYAAREVVLTPETIERFRAQYRAAFGVPQADPFYEAISEGRVIAGMEHWLPLFFDKLESIFSFVPACAVTLDAQADVALRERLAQITDFYQARKDLEAAQLTQRKSDKSVLAAITHPLLPHALYLQAQELQDALSARDVYQITPHADPSSAGKIFSRRGYDFVVERQQGQAAAFKALAAYITEQKTARRRTLIACYSEGARERLMHMMTQAGVQSLATCVTWEEAQCLPGETTALVVLPLDHGFVTDHLAVLTEQDVLGDRLTRAPKRKRASDQFLKEVSALAPGDLVVHIDHGIGRFEGLETVKAGAVLHDCLKLVYDGGDRLFVPVENIEVLSRFGQDEGVVPLDKLGGVAWQARKARIKKDLLEMADTLLRIAAERTVRQADVFSITQDVYEPFVSRFPYQETDDQIKAIEDVITDLSSGKPMDRLVCGDVGYGKTEIALRAAYVAASAGAQVAVIVPTTLLARQHTQNFIQRFEGLGLRVGQLSRFVSARETQLIKQGLADGSVQIVIGTHALFARDVIFAHLGLVIVDEEQRFGVQQKEKLKTLKANVHVLTLTATPIPRTLQMSLTGVKDMSIIASPPVDRLSVRTFVLPFDGLVIREAILRERLRGGQSFYVCPRISDIAQLEETLKTLVPEAKVVTAHGQMTPTELESRMSAFYDGQYDVLLATNIIESGLDIPRANTMIVHRADLFGLAQLYQIRGRVGRSKVRAYAYLTTDPAQKLTAQAQKRLDVLETLDTLGAGFQLAAHDMDLRGAGNLLGEAQSGHVREVGVELYQQMLEDAVAAARAGVDLGVAAPALDHWSPNINMGTSVLIPENYVPDLSVRLTLYRRLADLVNDQEIEHIAAELIDRFGPLPTEVQNLLDIVALKQLCRIARISKVEAGPKGAVISFYEDRPAAPDGLLRWISAQKGLVKLRPDQKIAVTAVWDSMTARVRGVQRLIADLAGVGKSRAA